MSTSSPSKAVLMTAGLLGVLGALLVGIAEFSLHYTPSHEYHEDYRFFLGTPAWRLTLGHFLAIFSVPLYFIGYWHVSQRLRPAAAWLRNLFFGAGVYAFSIGGVWIGSRVYLALLIQAEQQSTGETQAELARLLQQASYYNEQSVLVLRIAILFISALFVYLVASGKTSYPRWVALLNPIVLVLGSFALYFTLPAIGGYVMSIAMNVAHLIFFGVSTWLCWRTIEAPHTA